MKNDNSDPVKLLQKEIEKKKRSNARKALGQKAKPRGKPFAQGEDPRRNVSGSKPRITRQLTDMVLDILGEELDIALDPKEPQKTQKMSTAYVMLRSMALGKNPADHIEVLNRGFGKVAEETRNLSLIDDFILNNMDLFTDGQIQRIQAGEDKSAILSELLSTSAEIMRQKQQEENSRKKK